MSSVGDARKRMMPDPIEMDATTLRDQLVHAEQGEAAANRRANDAEGQIEHLKEVTEAAMVNHRRADNKRAEAEARVAELEHALVVQADKFNAIIEDLRYRNAELQADRNECKALHKAAGIEDDGAVWSGTDE